MIRGNLKKNSQNKSNYKTSNIISQTVSRSFNHKNCPKLQNKHQGSILQASSASSRRQIFIVILIDNLSNLKQQDQGDSGLQSPTCQ